jgi:hypothetical protein
MLRIGSAQTQKWSRPKLGWRTNFFGPEVGCGLVTKPTARVLKRRRPGPPKNSPTWVKNGPKTTCVVHLRSTVTRDFRVNKTVHRSRPFRNPKAFIPGQNSCTCERERPVVALGNCGGGVPWVCSATSVLPEGERSTVEPSHGGALRQIL